MNLGLAKLRQIVFDRSLRRSKRYRVPLSGIAVSPIQPLFLSSATIILREAKFIREFVCFHQLVGIEHMLMYLDGGYDHAVRDQLSDFVAAGFVELIPWPRFIAERNNQFLAYQHASQYMIGRTRWLAMIDADEFLFAPESGDLKAELKAREQYAAISVYSRTYGTGGVQSLADGELVIEKLTKRGLASNAKNTTQRTIAKPEMISAIRSANTCVLKDTSALGWDEDGRAVYATGEVGHGCAKLRINHYFTRAEEDFRAKLARQYFGKSGLKDKMSAKAAEAENDVLSAEVDTILHRYVPALRALYARNRSPA